MPDGSLLDGLNVLEIEARRVREHGFNQSELDRNKREMAAYYEQAYNERDKSESGGYADEYIRHFLEGEPAPGIEYEYRLVQNVLPGITLEEVTTLRTLAPVGPEPRRAGGAAGEAEPAAAVGRRPPRGDRRGRQSGGHAVERYDDDARARRKDPGAGARRIAPRARRTSASPSSGSPTASRRG